MEGESFHKSPRISSKTAITFKVEAFSGGRWKVPMVIRAGCGAGYGDGGQHGQSLWGWIAHIPGRAGTWDVKSCKEHPFGVYFG